MNPPHVVVAGGGAAGCFAAITCAEAAPATRVTVLEKSPLFLAKVRISGGGRCNVTHACFEPRDLSRHYPRGGAALRGPFTRFQPRDTRAWFERRGVKLKIEPDGRMFPASDSSRAILECLTRSARAAGVTLRPRCEVTALARRPAGGFTLALAGGERLDCERLMLATGGCRTAADGSLPLALGHSLEPPVPSLFAFRLATPWGRELAGVAVADAELSLPGPGLRERGPLLFTHTGLSGPAILRLSAWGARALHAARYQFPLRVNWLPHLGPAALAAQLDHRRAAEPARRIANSPLSPLPARLWQRLVQAAGIPPETRWAGLPRAARHQLIEHLRATELQVNGRSPNQDEFVTCGGVRLREVNFHTMESRLCPGLYFGGELLDIDGLTGGFNLQAAWTTGWIAGRAMAGLTGQTPP